MSEQHSETGIPPQWDQADRMGKALRVSGVTAAEMAKYLDVHRNTISGYIHGHHEPQRSVVILWAMRTGVPLEWILTGKQSAPHPAELDEGQVVRREGLEPPTRCVETVVIPFPLWKTGRSPGPVLPRRPLTLVPATVMSEVA